MHIRGGISYYRCLVIYKFVILLFSGALIFPSVGLAQSIGGWAGAGAGGSHASAYDACHAEWQHHNMNLGLSRFIGAHDYGDWPWYRQRCNWTRYQYLCREETGGGIVNCRTVIPSTVTFSCPSGYDRQIPGRCVPSADNRPERPPVCYNNGGNSNPTTDNPVILSTGAKVLKATDFSTADGKFVIDRNYRSVPIGRSNNIRQMPLGLIGGWQFNFSMEVQLGSFSGSMGSSPVGNVNRQGRIRLPSVADRVSPMSAKPSTRRSDEWA